MAQSGMADLSKPPVTVVAGVIEKDGLILIAQRAEGQNHALKWEFPGGKVEAWEDTRDALKRELEEELSIQARIGDEITRYEYQYPGRPPIRLIFYRVTEFEGEPVNRVFQEIRWESAQKLPEYDFLDGDVDFINRMSAEAR
jgi:8-oxo-dGTP diphosphatase